MLSPEQAQFFDTQGYLVLEDFATPEEVTSLRTRGQELLASYDPSVVTVFSCHDHKRIEADYLLESASNVSFFLEEGATDENGQLQCDKALAVNKIGHALHDVDEVFRRFSRSDKVRQLFKSFGYKRPIPVQSMYICKQPRIGGEVLPHQDDSFLGTEPPSAIGLWLALEDATVENGCMFVLPASHTQGPLTRYGRTKEHALQLIEGDRRQDWDLTEFTPLPAKKRTVVLLHGSVVHFSHENTSAHSRHAYTVHYVESTEGYTWRKDNWLQRPQDFEFEPLYEDSAPKVS